MHPAQHSTSGQSRKWGQDMDLKHGALQMSWNENLRVSKWEWKEYTWHNMDQGADQS